MVMLIFISLTVLGLAVYAIQLVATRACVRVPRVQSGFMPPVSILKPLKGLDDNLLGNLESFCRQDYPQYEIIFSLRDPNDPACKVARKVKEMHPDRDISIVIERCEDGLNPKVNNLIPGYRASRYGFVLISDSNVSVRKDYLKETVSHMEDPEVGLVSNMIRGVGGHSLGAVFENLHLNTFIAGGVCFLEKIMKTPCVVGKSMLLRKEYLEELGGLQSVKGFLAEDYILGRKMKELGKKVVLSNHIIDNVNEYWTVGQFMRRHARWGRLRWNIGRSTYILELIGNPAVMSLMPILILGPSRFTAPLPLLAWSVKATGDYYMGRMVGSDMRPALYLLSPVKDILIAIVWFIPIISNKIDWRGDRYIIGRDSALYPCPENGIGTVAAY
jgi:ceramide glucosyltransferase